MDNSEKKLMELRKIQSENNGLLFPEDVVEFARNPTTALHSAFEWNDGVAAEQYRIEQARRLIRVIVEVIPNVKEPVKAFVSLKTDRYESTGYRHMPTLMITVEGRKSVLETAIWELEAFQNKYGQLKELSKIFAEIKSLKRKVKNDDSNYKTRKS